MAALFQCFGRKRRDKTLDENADEPTKNGNGCKCKCNKLSTVLQCPHCKSTMRGYWERNDADNNKDGGVCAKIICPDRDSRSSGDHESRSDGNSPTRASPPQGAIFIEDYRPKADGTILSISHMPVSKDDPNYNMNHPRRGKALIFNFDKWDNTNIPTLDLSPRLGSRKDKQDLVNCLQKLSFEVETFDNLKRQAYDRVIDRVRREDHSDADCIVVAVMTHGEKNSIYLSDGSLIPVNSVWEEFEANSCPTLAGKPKIFIIQACRGDRYDHGTRLANGTRMGPFPLQNDVIDSGTFSYVIPNAADIIVAFSCPLGHYSWRHPERGSWFIQSICDVFNKEGHKLELQSLLTTVAREVAINYQSSTTQIESDRKKQVPSTSSTLIRNVNFRPKPFLSYGSNVTPISNGMTVESFPQTSHQNGNARHIRLQDVQVAVAEAQTSVENELTGIFNNTRRPDELPIMTVTESATTLEPSIMTVDLAQVDDNLALSEDLTSEDQLVKTPTSLNKSMLSSE